MAMQVTEIYRSLQGESTYAGLPCVFVRLTACNLRCTWCDTEYSFYGGKKMTPEQVFDEVEQLSPSGIIEFTGGEPMLQERELLPLMRRFLESGYTILLETSGERPLEHVPAAVVKIVDVKCPGSGEGDTFHMENLDALEPHDEIKFVISDRSDYEFACDRSDYEFACDFTIRHALDKRVNAVLFSPAFRKDAAGARDASKCLLDPQQLAQWML